MSVVREERMGNCDKKGEKIGDEEELEMLLGEIPYATSSINLQRNHQTKFSYGTMYGMYDDDPSIHLKHTTCGSPVSGFSLPSDGSSSSVLSNGNDSLSPPLPDELNQSHGNHHFPSVLLPPTFKVSDRNLGNFFNEKSVSKLTLSDHLSRMCIGNEQENPVNHPTLGTNNIYLDRNDNVGYSGRVFPENPAMVPNGCRFLDHSTPGAKAMGSNVDNFGILSPDTNRFHLGDRSIYGANRLSTGNYGSFENYQRGFGNYGVSLSSVSRNPHHVNGETSSSSFLGSSHGMKYSSNHLSSPHQITKATYSDYPINHPFLGDALLGSQTNMMKLHEDRGGLRMYDMPHNPHCTRLGVENLLNGRTRQPSRFRASTSDANLIVQENGLNFIRKKEIERLRVNNHKGSCSVYDIGLETPKGRNLSPRLCGNLIPPSKYESLVEVRGCIHTLAKDQDGCRFLQRVFEEGTPQEIQIVFGEIIGHIVELMVDPFGNYLMQKLLEMCDEEQRIQILLMLTEKPGQLIRISLNTHGTRVVQKLIETLKTRQQVLLVVAALEPGFLALIKDLNGNHVIKQCLQCFSNEDNKFIFVAASKYCVEVATHQHGCCVLQCCISLLTGKHRDNLVKEISANGILLAQDEYGNFVIQFILELEIPSAKSSLISQFEGNFVHLSTQKFSSHVVEKCLAVSELDMRSKIVHELLSAPHFKQLLQDPYANYVIGKALKLTEGSRLYNVLVEAIQCHESTLRNCPYSKKLLSALKQYRETTTSRKSPSARSF